MTVTMNDESWRHNCCGAAAAMLSDKCSYSVGRYMHALIGNLTIKFARLVESTDSHEQIPK